MKRHEIDEEIKIWLDFTEKDLRDIIEDKFFWSEFAKNTASQALEIKLKGTL